MRTAIGKWCGQHPHSREGAPGLHGVVVIVRDDLTAEPPAHCRLVSDHDLFEIVALLDCTASLSTDSELTGRGVCNQANSNPRVISLGEP